MKKLLIVLTLALCIGCAECNYDAAHFQPALPLLEQVKAGLKNSEVQYKDVFEISNRHPALSDAIHNLRKDYNLCDVKIYPKQGIAFKFNCVEKTETGCEYYILSAIDPGNAAQFYNSGQFADFSIEKKEYKKDWIFIKIKESE